MKNLNIYIKMLRILDDARIYSGNIAVDFSQSRFYSNSYIAEKCIDPENTAIFNIYLYL